jgi:tetratricopeptide (TPR) repeat protein
MTKIGFYSGIIIFSLVFIIYSNSFNVPFVFDDEQNIVYNPFIKDLGFFVNSEMFEGIAFDKTFHDNTVKDFFKSRIVGYFTFALNYNQHYFDVIGYHVINLLIHISNGILVYVLMIFTLQTPYFKGVFDNRALYSKVLAIFPALIFISHPVQTQAVTYIVQRFASLATMFYLMSIVFYVKFRLQQEDGIKCRSDKAKAIILYVISILSAVLGMKTKEIVFTLPVMIIAYEYMFLNGQKRRRFLNIIPFILTMLIIPLTLIKVNAIGDAVSIASSKDIRWWEYLFTQFRVVITYIRLLFVPINQNLDYDYPVYRTFWNFAVICSFMFHIAAIALGFYLYRKSRQSGREQLRLIAFGIFWFYVALSVESSIIPIADVIFEHRLYLPSVGFFMGISGLIVFGADKARVSNKVLVSLMVAVVVALSIATYKRNNVWRDEITLWEDVAQKSPNKARAYYNLALLYNKRAYPIEMVVEKYFKTISLKPDFAAPYNNLGIIYARHKQFDKALEAFSTAIRLNPNYVDAHNNLGFFYYTQGRYDLARKKYLEALKINSGFPQALNNLKKLDEEGR